LAVVFNSGIDAPIEFSDIRIFSLRRIMYARWASRLVNAVVPERMREISTSGAALPAAPPK
jgi:hypothetical protein